MSNQGLRQASVRAVTGTALTYEGDWHALFDLAGIPAGPFNGRMLAWINDRLGTTYPDLPGAMQAFAVAQGFYNWDSMGTFDAGGFEGILDQLATAPVAAWSVARVLKTDWLESALIRLRRASDNAESDFGADANGDLDTAAIATWIGVSSATLVRIYDQSGNGLNLTQTTAGNQPAYIESAIGGKPGFGIADSGDFLSSASASLDNLPGAGFAFHEVWRCGSNLGPLVTGKGFGASGGWRTFGNGSTTFWFAQQGASSSAKYWGRAIAADTDYADTLNYTGGTADDAVTRRTNGAAVTNSLFGSLTLPTVDDAAADFTAGGTGFSGVVHRQSEKVIFAATLSSGDLQTLNDDATVYYGV